MDRTAWDDRRAFSEFVRANFQLLRRYVQRRLRYYQALGMVQRGDLALEDVVNEAVVVALRRLGEKSPSRGFYPWFRRVADTVLRRQAQRSAARRHRLVSLEEPVGLTEEGEPIRLQDILPDPQAVFPAEALERHEVQQALDQALQRLPDEWREAFLLSSVDGYALAQIAALEGRPPEVIREDIRLAREFLREVLVSSAVFRLPDDLLPHEYAA
ncbi:MAG: sigma-70 family RNA polymerase sigma factor [Chloroflexi bacterium]|nr:sigma-70 family RNA polymerase sigma factor [Chloroflexota bacterium]